MKRVFKPFAKEDMPLFLSWAKKPQVRDTWFQEGYEAINKYYEKIEGNGYDYAYIIYLDEKPIGYIQTSDLYAYRKKCKNPKGVFTHEAQGTFCLDIFIGEEDYLDKGYGTQIVTAFVDKLLKEFKAKKILIDPASSNKRAIRCYEKAGFKIIRKENDGVAECCIMEYINNSFEVVKWSNQVEKQAMALLNQYEDTSFFLLSNLNTYGPKLGEETYSADFKCLVKNKKVVAVFALTKIGNLLLQTDHLQDYSSLIVNECLKDSLQLKGVVADWGLAKPVWDYVKEQLFQLKETAYQKDILFKILLNDLPVQKSTFDICYLKADDYEAWNLLNNHFLHERGLYQAEDENLKHRRFIQDTEAKYLMGLFMHGKIISMAAYTAYVNKTGVIGGVYTLPEKRRQGYSQALIYQLLLDGKINKKMDKVILFTGEDNIPAVKLYEGLGFERIGYFGLLFGEYET